MSTLQVYPAIDLRGGRVVRLAQGDPDRETPYDHDPLSAATRWCNQGATWLHVVNLDAALGAPDSCIRQSLRRILTAGARIQFGGGLRTMDTIGTAIDLGVHRVVLGTAAVHHPDLVAQAIDCLGPDRVAVGLDVRDGVPRTHGWLRVADQSALSLASHWAQLGLRTLIFTDINRDGMSCGANLEASANLARATGLDVIASGGVSSLEDVRRARQQGLSGIIIGRALYEGHVDLAAAIEIATSKEAKHAR